MRLELGTFPIEQVAFAQETRLEGRTLLVSREALIALVASDPAFAAVEVDLVRPRESARITQLQDVVEPRLKVAGPGGVFPGLLAPVETVGSGRTHRLGGLAVMTTGEVPWLGATGLFVPRDNLLDTAGLGAELSPYADLFKLVLHLEFAEGLDHERYQRAVLAAGLRAARYLAETTRQLDPPDLQVLDLAERDPDLPRVVYAYQVQSQGVFMRTYLYGRPLDELLPTLLHPNELADGALVSGGLGGHSAKIHTWMHQNHPLVAGLLVRHGRDWNFGGIILHRGHYYLYEDKQRVAIQVAKLAAMLRAQGVVFTLGGIGNNITEVMLAIQACERQGIKTVLLTWEHGGSEGADYPLPFAVPEAVAIVSTGSVDEPISLPAMDRVVGSPTIRVHPELGGVRLPVDGPVSLDNRVPLIASSNPLGHQRTGCRAL